MQALTGLLLLLLAGGCPPDDDPGLSPKGLWSFDPLYLEIRSQVSGDPIWKPGRDHTCTWYVNSRTCEIYACELSGGSSGTMEVKYGQVDRIDTWTYRVFEDERLSMELCSGDSCAVGTRADSLPGSMRSEGCERR